MSVLKDPAWVDYECDGNKDILAAKQALFFRSTFLPSLASALSSDRCAADHAAFANRLEERLKKRLLEHPAALDSLVQTVVLVKQSAA